MTTSIDLTAEGMARLNSATKYPSIETYHVLGKGGQLTEELGPFAGIDPDTDVVLTEKVDGTNLRIVLLPDGDYFIGVREELVYAKGDRIVPSLLNSATEVVIPYAEMAAQWVVASDTPPTRQIQAFYMEVYGHKIGGAAKNYTRGTDKGARLFDVAFIDPEMLGKPREEIASWRDHGGQKFAEEATIQRAARLLGIGYTPRLGTVKAGTLPTTVQAMNGWLESEWTNSSATVLLDPSGEGKSEGIVLRTKDRSHIAKARFQDYERTLLQRVRSGLKKSQNR